MPHTIAENLTRLQTARTSIANAITAKGGTVTQGDGFEEFPADIASIAGLPSGIEVAKLTPENNNISDSNMYIINAGNRTYVVGHFKRISGSPSPQFSYPSSFVPLFTKRPSYDTQNYYTYNQSTDAIINYSSGTAIISNNLVNIYGGQAGIIHNYAIMFTTN